MESLWRKQAENSGEKVENEASPAKQSVEDKEIRREVIVVGAGLAGLLTAYYLQQEGKQVLVLEADRVASGQTEKTTAKITSQHGLKYARLIETLGKERAGLYARANQSAIDKYERLIREKRIECEFTRAPAYLYVKKNEAVSPKIVLPGQSNPIETEAILKKEAEAAKELGLPAFFTTKTELPFLVEGAVCFEEQARFSPLKFVQFLAKQLEIWESTRVISIVGNRVMTENQVIQADKIVMAAHYPFRNLPGFYFMRQHQERSYVLALSGCKRIEGMYLGLSENGLSLRQTGKYLLLGGGAHRTGENQKGGQYTFLEQAAASYFPEGKIEARWSDQDCMPHDGIPFIGKYSVFTPQLYVVTGFQKWGMTSSMVAAEIICDALCGKENPYAGVFSPQRCHFRAGGKEFFQDAGISIKGLVKGVLHRPKEAVDTLPMGHGGIITMEGKRYGCYRDEKGELHCISVRCPHMGCELEWNPEEKSWDCPCHGSRFNVDGQLLDNPAIKNRD